MANELQRQTPTSDLPTTKLPSFAPLGANLSAALPILTAWTAGTDLSSKMTPELIESALVEAQARVTPSDETELMAMAASLRVRNFAATFSVPVNAGAVGKEYREHLGTLPADVIPVAIHRLLGRWKWGNRVPMPGDVKAEIADEMAERTNTVHLLLRAQWHRKRNPL